MKNTTITLLASVILLFFLFSNLFNKEKRVEMGYLAGKKAPALVLPLLGEENKVFNSEQLSNSKYKLINFFASWCKTCYEEHKTLLKLSNIKNLEIIGIAWKNNQISVEEWLKINGNPYKIIAMDRTGKKSKQVFRIIGVPETFLLSKDNTIISHIRGPVSFERITYMLKQN